MSYFLNAEWYWHATVLKVSRLASETYARVSRSITTREQYKCIIAFLYVYLCSHREIRPVVFFAVEISRILLEGRFFRIWLSPSHAFKPFLWVSNSSFPHPLEKLSVSYLFHAEYCVNARLEDLIATACILHFSKLVPQLCALPWQFFYSKGRIFFFLFCVGREVFASRWNTSMLFLVLLVKVG